MSDPLGSNRLVSDVLDRTRFATNYKNLKAVVMVEVNMKRGNDDFMVILLNVRERCLHVLLVVVVHQRDRPGDLPFRKPLTMVNQLGTDHVRQGLRPVVCHLAHLSADRTA